MPSFSTCKRIYGTNDYVGTPVTTIGEAHKAYSDMVMEETFKRDIQYQIGYFYDYYHDDYRNDLNDLNPADDPKKEPVGIKFVGTTQQTYSKDYIDFHLQLLPSQGDVVDYYDQMFRERYGAEHPCGLYVDIHDSKGKYNRWLVVGMANYNDLQFPTYELLRCDHVFQWIYNGKKYFCPGVLRSQNSYVCALGESNLVSKTL